MGGWVLVDPDDVIYRLPIKRSLKGIFVTSSGHLDRTSLWGYLLSVLLRSILRYKDDIYVRQKSLHMYPTSTFYITYRKLWPDVHRTIGRQLVSPPQHLHYLSDHYGPLDGSQGPYSSWFVGSKSGTIFFIV